MNQYRYLQECNAWLEAGNTFVESEIVYEGDLDDEIDETNPRVRAIRAKIFMKQEKKESYEFFNQIRPYTVYIPIRRIS